MADPFLIVPPKDIPTWMYEAFRKMNARVDQVGAAVSAIGRGESPDGSGEPLLDMSVFFYLPGRTGGQTSYQSDKRYPTLTMTQPTILSDAVELLRFYTAGKMVKFKPTTFSVVCSTDGSTTLTATGTPNFAPTGGPRVTEGMLITGTNIPAGTYVRRVTNTLTLTMTQAASGSGATTVTFESSVDISAISDETGRDIEWKAYGSVRFTPGTEGVPLRVSGDFSPIATGGSNVARLYLEAGYISSGNAVGTNVQIGGPNRGEAGLLNLTTRLLHIARSPASGTDINIGIGINPAEFGTIPDPLAGPGVNVLLQRTAETGVTLITGGSSTNAIFAVATTSTISGSSPTKTFALGTAWTFKITEDQRVHFGNAGGGGFYLQGSTDAFNLVAESTGVDLLAGSLVTSWSDSVTSHALNIGGLIGGSARRVFLASSGHAIFDRFGIGATYILLTDAQAGSADFLTGTGSPLVRVFNSVTVGNVAFEVRGMSGQTGNLTEWNANGTALSAVTAAGLLGILTTSPTNAISLGGEAARTIWMERRTAANVVGNALTVQAGGASVGGTNRAGGNLILATGASTGNAHASVLIQTPPPGSSGTGTNNPSTKVSVDGFGQVVLTSARSGNTLTPLTMNSTATTLGAGAFIGQFWSLSASGATDTTMAGLSMQLTCTTSASDTGGSSITGFAFEIYENGTSGTGAAAIAINGFIRHSSTATGMVFIGTQMDIQTDTGAGACDIILYTTAGSNFSAAVTSWIGYKVVDFTPTATITNAYGIYIEDFSPATNNWAIYSAGGQSVHVGKFSIGATTSPTEILDLFGNLKFPSGGNIITDTTTGTKIGTATSQKLSFWNAAPIVQPTTAIAAATFIANTSGIANDTATFDGYTIGQVVKALRNAGLLA